MVRTVIVAVVGIALVAFAGEQIARQVSKRKVRAMLKEMER